MSDELTQFKDCFREAAPAFFQEFLRTEAAEPNTLARLGGSMLGWAKVALGDEYADLLIEGYCSFVMEVNRAQRTYEASGHYEYSTFSEVYVKAYSNKDFMNLYHWGVYCSTFIWLHHLKIYQFFERYFLPILANQQEVGQLVDLGSGSGIWHLLALEQLPSWQVTAWHQICLARRISGTCVPMLRDGSLRNPWTQEFPASCWNTLRDPKSFSVLCQLH
jgi:hypothetical protein